MKIISICAFSHRKSASHWLEKQALKFKQCAQHISTFHLISQLIHQVNRVKHRKMVRSEYGTPSWKWSRWMVERGEGVERDRGKEKKIAWFSLKCLLCHWCGGCFFFCPKFWPWLKFETVAWIENVDNGIWHNAVWLLYVYDGMDDDDEKSVCFNIMKIERFVSLTKYKCFYCVFCLHQTNKYDTHKHNCSLIVFFFFLHDK